MIKSASEIVKSHWGLAGDITQLPGERDLNFMISGKDSYILKVYEADISENLELLKLQNLLLESLDSLNIGMVPKLIKSLKNEGIITAEISNKKYYFRLLTWIDGTPWGEQTSHSIADLEELGALIARVDQALHSVEIGESEHSLLTRPFMWNMIQASKLLAWTHKIEDEELREIIEKVLLDFEQKTLPRLKKLPMQVIHNDANDFNIISSTTGLSLIDFGDAIFAPRIVSLAVASAYVACLNIDSTKDVANLVRGYHRTSPLTAEEVAILFPLIKVRLAASVANAAEQLSHSPENSYLGISQSVVPETLRRLIKFNENHAWFRFRDAIGLEANPNAKVVRDYLATLSKISSVVTPSLAKAKKSFINWSFDNPDIPRTTEAINRQASEDGAEVTIGYYCENRNVYEGEAFNHSSPSARTFHLGVDLGMPAGSEVFAPLPGVIEYFNNNETYLDYGPVIILRHETDSKIPFWTLYGHLSIDSMSNWKIGKSVAAGELIGRMGTEEENVGWPPHTHFQLLTDLCGMGIDIYGVAPRDEVSLWRGISLNPNLILGINEGVDAHGAIAKSEIKQLRSSKLASNLSLNFTNPLQIVKGEGAYLFDETGRSYLDLVNNVAHVGHCHPRVITAAHKQISTLNTNTRFLHQTIIDYGKALTNTLPDPLSVIFFVNSGSEANDLAIRLARAHTKARGVISLRHGYHGNSQSVIEISPYKFLGKGGQGTPKHVGVAELPDTFRGKYRGDGAVSDYLANLDQVISDMSEPLSAFFAESIVSTAGQITLPKGYLAKAYQSIRSAGGVCVSDEVQIGLGRVGEKFWGFELHDVVPDIVTMGKPLGNGHPLAAVVTTPEIANSFNNGMEYFNTFGGNPVSAAIGQSVLEVVYDERLQLNAKIMGQYLRDGVELLRKEHDIIADVRGHGLFIGVEFLTSDNQPARKEVSELLEFALTRGVMLSSDGPDNNVLKIKPPLIINRTDIDLFLNTLSDWLTK